MLSFESAHRFPSPSAFRVSLIGLFLLFGTAHYCRSQTSIKEPNRYFKIRIYVPRALHAGWMQMSRSCTHLIGPLIYFLSIVVSCCACPTTHCITPYLLCDVDTTLATTLPSLPFSSPSIRASIHVLYILPYTHTLLTVAHYASDVPSVRRLVLLFLPVTAPSFSCAGSASILKKKIKKKGRLYSVHTTLSSPDKCPSPLARTLYIR